MNRIEKFEANHLRKICDILAATENGLSNSEIDNYLKDCKISTSETGQNKRTRLFEALNQKQDTDNCGNNVIKFITTVMDPLNYAGSQISHELFEERRRQINTKLIFMGYQINQSGKFHKVTVAKNISEAEERANELRKKLMDRNIHPEILKYAKKELLIDNNYFHSVFESCKGVCERIRELSGLTSDGSRLIDDAFGIGGNHPVLAFNTLSDPNEKNEHNGFMFLCKGLIMMVRNTTAHRPKIFKKMDLEEALDYLSLASTIHKVLDKVVRTNLN